MFESLFGAETPLPVRFFIAFIVVFALIGVTAWVIRRFGSDQLRAQGRGRQPRLAVIDAANVDSRRRLILIRRDNVEHLLMVGGGSDVVVETNIVRANAASVREAPAPRVGTADPLPRAVPLEEATSWPLAPEPGPRPRPNIPEDIGQWPAPEPPPRPPQRTGDPLSGLSADPAGRTAPEPRPEPKLESKTAAAAPKAEAAAVPADQNLADIAFRLEAALRRGGAEIPTKAAARDARAAEAKAPARPAKPPEAQRAEPRVPRPEPAKAEPPPAETAKTGPEPAKPQAAISLEEEMASLLGRSTGKTP